jgi:hypothetical protein
MIERTCPVCDTVYLVDPHRLKHGRGIACSRKCSYVYRGQKRQVNLLLECTHCKTQFARKPFQNRRTEKPFCSRKCFDEFRKRECFIPGMKICTHPDCIYQGQPQSIENFNKSPRSKDGKDWWCKDCKKEWQRQRDKDAERERNRRYKVSPEGIAARKRYEQSDRNKELTRLRQQKARNDPEKALRILARNKLNKAIRAGKIPHISTQQCKTCSQPANQYHHYLGYEPEHWYDVEPLCYTCHATAEATPHPNST